MFNRTLIAATAFVVALGAATALASAQTQPTPAPARHTVITDAYDGKLHVNLTPYIWLPSVNGNFAFHVPSTPSSKLPGGVANLNFQVGPNQYLAKINFAIMGAVDVRQGRADAFGDYINLNGTAGNTYLSSVTGPLGHLTVPVNAGVSAHLFTSIWEAGAGLTFAQSDYFSSEAFAGYRNVRVGPTIGYNLQVGSGAVIARNGTVSQRESNGTVIFGLKGNVALGDGYWYLPYYVDYGTGLKSQTWQAYGGVGRATRGGSFLLLFRELNYDYAPGESFVQKLRLGGPLVGYTIKL